MTARTEPAEMPVRLQTFGLHGRCLTCRGFAVHCRLTRRWRGHSEFLHLDPMHCCHVKPSSVAPSLPHARSLDCCATLDCSSSTAQIIPTRSWEKDGGSGLCGRERWFQPNPARSLDP
ncbi:hypothetical protein JMJ77_0002146, partial [Colletotrichum scovillei]